MGIWGWCSPVNNEFSYLVLISRVFHLQVELSLIFQGQVYITGAISEDGILLDK